MSTRELARKPAPATPRPAAASHGAAGPGAHGHGHGHSHGHGHGHAHGHGHGHGHGHAGPGATPGHRPAPGHLPGQAHPHHGHGHLHGVRCSPPAHSEKPAWQLASAPGQQLNILPGQLCFSTHPVVMRTLLGSCVSITLWHPQRRIGGMCHFLLPQRQRKAGDPADGRYGDEAVETLVEILRRHQTRPDEYHCHLYGGADTLPDGHGLKFNVGERNIERGWQLVDQYGFQLQGVDVGEDIARNVTLTLASGEVEMKRGAGRAPVVLPTAHAVRTVSRR